MQYGKKIMKISHVIEGISALPAMSHISAKDYAIENGWAHVVAQDIQRYMKFTQLRKFFDSVKQIKMALKRHNDDEQIDDILGVDQQRYELFPELAYALGRNLITQDFYKLMRVCLQNKVVSVRDFRAFEKFLSAIVAYCKMESRKV